ncbi:hypothetical protein ABW20_dc0106819 [Dactylellina cionopaga]|nr:hypothetical protein ABW20_dc0106819 [Dactylellina cionopaga]
MDQNTPPHTPFQAGTSGYSHFAGSSRGPSGQPDLSHFLGHAGIKHFHHPSLPTPGTLSKAKCEQTINDGGPMTPLKRLITDEIMSDGTFTAREKLPQKQLPIDYDDPMEVDTDYAVASSNGTAMKKGKAAILAPVETWDDQDGGHPPNGPLGTADIHRRVPLRELSPEETAARDQLMIRILRERAGQTQAVPFTEQENALLYNTLFVPRTPEEELMLGINELDLEDRVAPEPVKVDISNNGLTRGPQTGAARTKNNGHSIRGGKNAHPAVYNRNMIRPTQGLQRLRSAHPMETARQQKLAAQQKLAGRAKQSFKQSYKPQQKKGPTMITTVSDVRDPSTWNIFQAGHQDNIISHTPVKKGKLQSIHPNIMPPAATKKVRKYAFHVLPKDWIGHIASWGDFVEIWDHFENGMKNWPGYNYATSRDVKKLYDYWFVRDNDGDFIKKYTHFDLPD